MALPQVQIAPPQVPMALAPHQVGIFPAYITTQTETLILREKVMSLSGDDFEIRHAMKVYDMRGNHLFSIVREHFHIHTTYAVEDTRGTKIMEVKSSFRLFGSKATATFNSIDGSAEVLQMDGSWHDYNANIVDTTTGNVVARIDRRLSGRDLLFGQQTYALVVSPRVDMALMAALCICLDEKNNEK
ncbi:tubby C-terminal-like domain-containing protein [Fusarium oxysporum]|nr:tubby C-terminal-like domain-containing protein [Fusarium oxysporum]